MHAIHIFVPAPNPGAIAPSIRAQYEQAIAPIDGARIIWHTVSGRSSAFVTLANRWRGQDGRVMRNFKAENERTDDITTSLVCFSAGYGAVREMLWHPDDRAAVDAVVCLDAVHAGWEDDGTPSDAMLAGFTQYAKMAKSDASKLLWLGHSDVPTAKFPAGYPSTTDTAAELVRLADGQGGQFLVQAYNLKPANQPKAEHSAALSVWGAGFMAEALRPHFGRIAAERRGALPWRNGQLSVGERCTLWSLAQVALGSLETWGRNAGPLIADYFRGATRRNKKTGAEEKVGIDRGDWCIVALCEAEDHVLLPGEERVLIQRVAGWEIVEDAIRDGSWVTAEEIRAGEYAIRVGDVGVNVRPKMANPEFTKLRHGWRAATVPNADGVLKSVDGNSGKDGKRWATNARSIHDPDFLGVRPYPQPAAEVLPHYWAEAVKASAEVMLGREGLDYALAGLLDAVA